MNQQDRKQPREKDQNLQVEREKINIKKQRKKLITPIQDQVLIIVQQIAKEKKYDFIFDRSSDIVMLYSAKNYDISDLVLKRLKINEKRKEKKERLKALKTKNK
jgi:Skp family chaperone for outer membrane proteins